MDDDGTGEPERAREQGEGVLTRRPRLVYVVTAAVTANVLLRGQLAFMREAGFDVTVICTPGPQLDAVAAREHVGVVGVAMEREIAPAADALSFVRLVRVLRELKPDIINASTAKAGLLGGLAAVAARVPIRIYLARGSRAETTRGLKRTVLGATERTTIACAQHVICVSESLREHLVATGVAPAAKTRVLGSGASNGIDADRFSRTEERIQQAAEIRARHGIPSGAPVLGFIGRPVADKGIGELLDAFAAIRAELPETHLMFIGAGFAGDAMASGIADRLREPNIVSVGQVDEPAPYYVAMDVLAFPSHREGMPNSPLEAAACEVPTVGSRATGVVDAIIDDVTGALVDMGDAAGLATALLRYLRDPQLRAQHGKAARQRVISTFRRELVWERWRDEYIQLLADTGLSLPVASRDRVSKVM